MSFTTWISDPNVHWNNLTLDTKKRSYDFGRRLYTFQVEKKKYWLKFHVADTDPVIECAFQCELDFYQLASKKSQHFLLPYHIIQMEQTPQCLNLETKGSGLILLDAENFFTDVLLSKNIASIQQKIGHALDALDHMHQIGWIHGDLKVEHFRLYEGSCRLIDFEQSFQSHCSIPIMNATPHYMAPELFHGEAKSIQSDLYALGMIVYEWLTQTKLQAKTYHDWAVLHCQQLQIQLPQDFTCLFPFLNGLMQKHIELRFKSVADAKDCLNTIGLLRT
ncbi:protein kinase [Acinetobacter sp. NIPH 2699]|uniref:protein kinase domain-containing protein n=1 Tax=Acinetobacter sp. NIPH 2699 TaxID=2923433 RepID=UPI001F4BC04B|nr:protein kinase [Acinetobacter sp. NIPH 2699]MCH7335894.1 protein kinase [Acinetobacter sp. NIPH 2699]